MTNLKAGLALDLRAGGAHAQADRLEQEALGTLVRSLGEPHRQTRYMAAGKRPYGDFEPQII